VLKTIKKGFKWPIDRTTLTLTQIEVVQKARRNDQLALTIIHQCLDDTSFEIMVTTTTVKKAWEVLQESNQEANNVRKVHL
jgi:hypothetical protein